MVDCIDIVYYFQSINKLKEVLSQKCELDFSSKLYVSVQKC